MWAMLLMGSFCQPRIKVEVPGLRVRGTQIVTSQGKQVQLRGFNVCWWVPPTEQDAKDIAAMGGNCVRVMFGYQPEGKFNPEKVAEVREQSNFTRIVGDSCHPRLP